VSGSRQIQSVRGGAKAAGREVPETHAISRQEGRDPEVNDKVSRPPGQSDRQLGRPEKGASDYLKTIKQPTLIVNAVTT